MSDVVYRHTPEMGEISGFGRDGDPQGIKYEECCQDMLEAGVKWVHAHPDADLKIGAIQNVIGLVWTEGDAAELEKVVVEASRSEPDEDGVRHVEATGAMVHTILSRLFYIRHEGWDKYVEELQKQMRGGDE